MRFVSKSVLTGFVNALAILIFLAQLPELIGVPNLTYGMLALGLLIIFLLPRVTKVMPSPLVCLLLTFVAQGLNLNSEWSAIWELSHLACQSFCFLMSHLVSQH